ncbi:MAG: hypothetical protein Ct9H300mP7_4710 [Verrucomicrobiota bacterium]|nr:MAG: hypothetical protein Ct9H300mP7_4710 [Verrucomicrobiota bacterium]
MFVKHNGLQAVSKYARQVWEFVNLYSKTRGANRFPALGPGGLTCCASDRKCRPATSMCPATRHLTNGWA